MKDTGTYKLIDPAYQKAGREAAMKVCVIDLSPRRHIVAYGRAPQTKHSSQDEERSKRGQHVF